MAAKPTIEPTLAHKELEELDEGEESDDYEFEGEEEGDSYQLEDEEDEGDEDEVDDRHTTSGNITALLLGNQNGTTDPDEDDEEDDEDDEYQDEDAEGTAENPIVVGSKRSVEELEGDGDEETGEETDTKKIKV